MLSKATSLLREWRSKTGLTTREAAALIGISNTSYWNYERGVADPRASTIAAVERATGGHVSAASWIEAEPESPEAA